MIVVRGTVGEDGSHYRMSPFGGDLKTYYGNGQSGRIRTIETVLDIRRPSRPEQIGQDVKVGGFGKLERQATDRW